MKLRELLTIVLNLREAQEELRRLPFSGPGSPFALARQAAGEKVRKAEKALEAVPWAVVLKLWDEAQP